MPTVPYFVLTEHSMLPRPVNGEPIMAEAQIHASTRALSRQKIHKLLQCK